MSLKAPSRLPKSLRRRASPFTRFLARKHCRVVDRRARRRKEFFVRMSRRTSKLSAIIASEFKIWTLIGVSIISATVIAILLFSPYFNVREMQIRRQDPRIDPEEIQDMLSPLFHQKLLLVSRSQVMGMLALSYPDIEKIEIAKNYPSKLTVTLYLERVIAEVKIDEGSSDNTGSGSALLSGSGTNSYSYVTKRGYFITSPMKLASAPLPILTITDWAIRPQNRSLLLSEAFLQNVFLAQDTLRRDFGLTTVNTVVFLRAQEFHIQTNKANLWFDLRSPLSVQFQRFRSFLKTVSLEGVKNYIDLRIADKIIYQ